MLKILQKSISSLSQHLCTFDFSELELAFQICWNAGNTLSYPARQIDVCSLFVTFWDSSWTFEFVNHIYTNNAHIFDENGIWDAMNLFFLSQGR